MADHKQDVAGKDEKAGKPVADVKAMPMLRR